MLLMTAACASLSSQEGTSPSGTSQMAFTQLKAAPDAYRGHAITIGGKILQWPLSSSLQPPSDLSKSQGRFVAVQKEFLDPATVPAGTVVTVTGEIAGSVMLPFDETEYLYPVVEIKNLRVWPKDDATCPQACPYPCGPGPDWGPYWGPHRSPYLAALAPLVAG